MHERCSVLQARQWTDETDQREGNDDPGTKGERGNDLDRPDDALWEKRR